MKTDKLTKFWKILYYTWGIKFTKKRHKNLQIDINYSLIRIIHPLGIILFILKIIEVSATQWFLHKDFINNCYSWFTFK